VKIRLKGDRGSAKFNKKVKAGGRNRGSEIRIPIGLAGRGQTVRRAGDEGKTEDKQG